MQGGSQVLLMYAAIAAIFYFVILRPQQQQRKKHQAMLDSMQKGDTIVTAGGVIGEVVFIAQQSKDGKPVMSPEDQITIKSGETRLLIERGRIVKLTRKDAPDTKA